MARTGWRPGVMRAVSTPLLVGVLLVFLFAAGGVYYFYYGPLIVCACASPSSLRNTTSNQGINTTTLSNGVVEYVYPTSNLTSSISSKVGEIFIIQLSSNAGSTAYDWKVTTSPGLLYLNYTVVSTSTAVGGSQVRNYFFRASQNGNQTIDLLNERLFAPYAVGSTIHIEVTVSAANGIVAPTIIGYNFQTNSTSGSLFVVWKNYGSVAINIAKVYLDQVLVNNSSMKFGAPSGSTCGSLKMCELTLYFGGNTLPLPSQGDHVLKISTSGGDFQYTVTTGMIYHAGCTYTASC